MVLPCLYIHSKSCCFRALISLCPLNYLIPLLTLLLIYIFLPIGCQTCWWAWSRSDWRSIVTLEEGMVLVARDWTHRSQRKRSGGVPTMRLDTLEKRVQEVRLHLYYEAKMHFLGECEVMMMDQCICFLRLNNCRSTSSRRGFHLDWSWTLGKERRSYEATGA